MKEDDITKLRDRQKRLELRRKIEIIAKDKESTEYQRLIRQSEEFLVQKKRLASVIKNKEALNLRQTLLEVTTKSRVLTPRTMEKI